MSLPASRLLAALLALTLTGCAAPPPMADAPPGSATTLADANAQAGEPVECKDAPAGSDPATAPSVAAFRAGQASALAQRVAEAAGDKLGAAQGDGSWRTSNGTLTVRPDPRGADGLQVVYERKGLRSADATGAQAFVAALYLDADVRAVADGDAAARLVQDLPGGGAGGELEVGQLRFDPAADVTRLTLHAPRDVAGLTIASPDAVRNAVEAAATCRDDAHRAAARWAWQPSTPATSVVDGKVVLLFDRAPGHDWTSSGSASVQGDDCPAGWSLALDAQSTAVVSWTKVPCVPSGSPGGV